MMWDDVGWCEMVWDGVGWCGMSSNTVVEVVVGQFNITL